MTVPELIAKLKAYDKPDFIVEISEDVIVISAVTPIAEITVK